MQAICTGSTKIGYTIFSFVKQFSIGEASESEHNFNLKIANIKSVI